MIPFEEARLEQRANVDPACTHGFVKTLKLLYWSGLAALFLGVIPVVQRVALLPLYLNGHGQETLSLINRLSALLVLPGKLVLYHLWPMPEHYFITSRLLVAAILNTVLYFVCVLIFLRFVFKRKHFVLQLSEDFAEVTDRQQQTEVSPAQLPESPLRRAFLIRTAMGLTCGGVLAAGLAPVLLVPGWVRIRRLTFPLQGLPPSLEGLTIAQLTDFHHDEWISIEHVRDIIRMTNMLNPDVVALTGDYVTSRPELIRPALQEIARLKPRIGCVGVLGNHDWWAGVGETRRQFAEANIPLVDNGRLFLSADRRLISDATDGICIAGVGDLWEDEIDLAKALHNVPQAMPRILLSHNPDVAEEDSLGGKQNRVDLMLSGHTHGGQVRLPYVGTPIVPSAYGSKYVHGLVRGPHCAVHISAGIGMAMLPVRMGVPPEIVLITLTSAGGISTGQRERRL